MDVAIIGSREFNGPVAKKYLTQVLDHLLPGFFDEIRIISGGAKGADSLAEEYAKENDLVFRKYPANWNDVSRMGAIVETRPDGSKYDKAAGIVRDLQMARDCDACVAFWVGGSKGTEDMIGNVLELDKPIYVLKGKALSDMTTLYKVDAFHPTEYFNFKAVAELTF